MNALHPIRVLLLRSLVLTVLTFGSGMFLYWLLGVTVLSAVLFAVACGVASALASFVG